MIFQGLLQVVSCKLILAFVFGKVVTTLKGASWELSFIIESCCFGEILFFFDFMMFTPGNLMSYLAAYAGLRDLIWSESEGTTLGTFLDYLFFG